MAIAATTWARSRELPAKLAGFVAELPDEQQFEAEMLLFGAVEVHRDHELTAAIGVS